MKWPAGLGLLLLLVVGCGGSGDGGGSATISSQPLSGKIGGQAWMFTTGETSDALSTSEQLWVDLYADSFDACVAFGAPPNADLVTMMMPRAPGSYDVNLTLNATIYSASTATNYVATSGRLVIDSVTATTIAGGLNITYNGDNAVNGQFQATICPP
jgi:hypothetical protein